MAISSLSRRQQAKTLACASAVAAASWLYFSNVWRGVVLSGAGDPQAVSFPPYSAKHRRQIRTFSRVM